jgi:hypothetical protein
LEERELRSALFCLEEAVSESCLVDSGAAPGASGGSCIEGHVLLALISFTHLDGLEMYRWPLSGRFRRLAWLLAEKESRQGGSAGVDGAASAIGHVLSIYTVLLMNQNES